MAEKRDDLTGLHVGVEDDLKRLLNQTDGVALVLLDVDRFMEINAAYGREAGDRVLQAVGRLLEEACPEGPYRTAGDEFGAILPGVSLEQAFLRMEALRAKIEAEAPQMGLPPSTSVTITAGVAHCPRDAKDAVGLMRAAYAALAAAKEGGRNQVALAPNEEMVMKSCYYSSTSLRKLKALAELKGRKESALLREALDDLLRKYDQP